MPETPSVSSVPVVLDTDIGSDVDDLLALLILATDRSVDLRAVTTVYGDVDLRARLAGRVLRLLGRDDVPVHAGAALPQSGREVVWFGHEGVGLEGLDQEVVSDVDGVDKLLAAAAAHRGELVVMAIGPLTNIAAALDRDPDFASALRLLVVMGGEFAEERAEHNIRCDVVAARKVLGSGLPSTYVGLDVTTTVWFEGDDLTRICAAGSELGTLVESQVKGWWAYKGRSRSNPHDPLAALSLLEPTMFQFAEAGWRVIEEEGERLGALVGDDASPPIAYGIRVDRAAARKALLHRLENAVRQSH